MKSTAQYYKFYDGDIDLRLGEWEGPLYAEMVADPYGRYDDRKHSEWPPVLSSIHPCDVLP